MARDYKLNKSELTRLKREEKLYCQYLPVLKLKQEQLQLEDNRCRKALREAISQKNEALARVEPFIPCFADTSAIDLTDALAIEAIVTHQKCVAGVSVRALSSIRFQSVHIPYFQTAPWLLRVLKPLQELLSLEARVRLMVEERDTIKRELSKATQKVNLFEMVLIPHTKTAIKKIRIALSDEQIASISRGKAAKAKKAHEAVL